MDTNQRIGRRRSLQIFGSLVATGVAVAACSKSNPEGASSSGGPATGAKDCNTAPDEAAKATRKQLQYKKEATDPEKRCEVCAQYQAGAFGACGGCKLFGGPVQPKGGCLSFAPMGAEAGTPT